MKVILLWLFYLSFLQIFSIAAGNRIDSKIGYVIGVHSDNETWTPPVTMMRDSELCCGFGPEDLGINFHAPKYNSDAVPGLKLKWTAAENRTAGISAHVTSC